MVYSRNKQKILDNVEVRIFAVEVLKFLKRFFNHSELSHATGIPVSMISQYIQGHHVPSLETAKRIINILSSSRIDITKRILKSTGDKISDAVDFSLLKILSKATYSYIERKSIEFDTTAVMNDIFAIIGLYVSEKTRTNLLLLSIPPLLTSQADICLKVDTPHLPIVVCMESRRIRRVKKVVFIKSPFIDATFIEALGERLRVIDNMHIVSPICFDDQIYNTRIDCVFGGGQLKE